MNETAEEYFRQAYEAQMAGELDRAVSLYRKSIELGPTAEAHTFLGWTYSFQRKYDEAIQECHLVLVHVLVAQVEDMLARGGV